MILELQRKFFKVSETSQEDFLQYLTKINSELPKEKRMSKGQKAKFYSTFGANFSKLHQLINESTLRFNGRNKFKINFKKILLKPV